MAWGNYICVSILTERGQDGTVSHKTALELSVDADSPLPHGLLYLRRLRVLTQVCRYGPGLVLDNIHCHHLHCGPLSWLSGAQEAVDWAKANADSRDWISNWIGYGIHRFGPFCIPGGMIYVVFFAKLNEFIATAIACVWI